jgi:RNA polymerase sigma factor (sigma-70 family)
MSMANGQFGGVLRQLRRAAFLETGPEPTDGQMLERFLRCHDGDAFAALVSRHGPMVLGVCRRLLRNEADAEDAFQATFLVLVKKAAAVSPRERVGSWLHGVAYRTALKARTMAARRRVKEHECGAMPRREPRAAVWDQLEARLDEELERLPERYRLPVLLCDLGGKSYQDAARQLGWPVGTLSGRLTRARALLARRLARPGLAVLGGALAALTPATAQAHVPQTLTAATVKSATVLAANPALASGTIPNAVARLTQEVLRAMTLTKIKIATAVVLTMLAAAAIGVPAFEAVAQPLASLPEAPAPEVERPRAIDMPPAVEIPLERAAALIANDEAGEERLRGSGKEATKEFKLADFTTVDIGHVIHVDITRGDKFRVVLTADDNLLDLVQAAKDGATLRISLDTAKRAIPNGKWKLSVTMPKLEGVSVSGCGHVTFKGFKGGDFKARAHAASHLEGEIEAAKLDLEVAGASHATLRGSAKDAKLTATGASRLALADFAIDRADVHLTGASSAKIKVKEKLDYNLSGACHLEYQGGPTIGTKKATGASSASHKGK